MCSRVCVCVSVCEVSLSICILWCLSGWSLRWWLLCSHPLTHPLTLPLMHEAVCFDCAWQWVMADWQPQMIFVLLKLQPSSSTQFNHSFCQSATTELATVCVLPPSLLQASRTALRQAGEADTHTHHSTPRFFGRGEKRSKQSLDITTIFLRFLMESCCKIQKYLSKISVFLPRAESCFKEARSIILTKGICTTQPACQ